MDSRARGRGATRKLGAIKGGEGTGEEREGLLGVVEALEVSVFFVISLRYALCATVHSRTGLSCRTKPHLPAVFGGNRFTSFTESQTLRTCGMRQVNPAKMANSCYCLQNNFFINVTHL